MQTETKKKKKNRKTRKLAPNEKGAQHVSLEKGEEVS